MQERLGLEIQMIVMPAAGIEARPARRADGAALEVVRDRQFVAAGSAQNRPLSKRRAGPHPGRMVCFCFMALITSVVRLAAGEFDGEDIERAAVMSTAALRGDLHAVDWNAMNTHASLETEVP